MIVKRMLFRHSAALVRAIIFVLISIPVLVIAASAQDTRPNILLIISDDQRLDTMRYMPKTNGWIFDRGAQFTNAYISTPICGPSRASILTGSYAHRHGMKFNSSRLKGRTVTHELKDAGYYTGLVGKYLNSWSGKPRPEFDYWTSFPFGDTKYIDPKMYFNGVFEQRTGYLTDLLRDEAINFIHKASLQSSAFFLVYAPFSPHGPAVPDQADKKLFKTLPHYRPPNFDLQVTPFTPPWLIERGSLAPKQITRVDKFRTNQLRTLQSLDRSIDMLMETLQSLNQLENTVVMYISDNGIQWGEHGLMSKDIAYEESSHVPFAVRYDRIMSGPFVRKELVSNIDIAPTIYEFTGIKEPREVQGRSLVPLLYNKNEEWKRDVLIEGWRNGFGRSAYSAIRTTRHLYVEYTDGGRELFELAKDPNQINNLIGDPGLEETIAQLSQRLKILKATQ